MPQESWKVIFASEAHLKAMLYILPPVNEAAPVPSPPKRSQRIYEVDSSPKSSGEGSSVKPQAAKAPYCPISQLIIPAQPKPRKKHDSEATGHQGHPQDLVIPAASKATGNCTHPSQTFNRAQATNILWTFCPFGVQVIELCTEIFWKVESAFQMHMILLWQRQSGPWKIITRGFWQCRSVVEQQRWLLEELERLQMEQEKYAM
ncbi:hypothetical protein BS17DRAFT_765986 [Gyrodon lividus]|nr:hypothetical protein BS17DRAFT_765986 [Gyrodon lividus]